MEIWKDIKGYEGLYQVSNLGRVKSLERYVRCGTNGNGKRKVNERILRAGAYCKTGHVSVVLRKHGTGQPVHKLVMEAFVGARPENYDICHNDGNPKNNKLENLRYDTRRNNNIDVFKHGRTMGTSKLSLEEVKEIKKLLAKGHMAQAAIAQQFDVSATTLSKIASGKSHSWVVVT